MHRSEHGYGERVTIFDDPVTATLLARLGSPDSTRAEVLANLRSVYAGLCAEAAVDRLPRVRREVPTRMEEKHPGTGIWRGELVDPASEVVVVDVIRGGIVPSQVCFEALSRILPEDHVRLDHLHMSRVTGPDGSITGTDLFGSKIGGPVEGRHLFVPDPMGATGSTVVTALDHYLESFGTPASVSVLTAICTPEFLRRVLEHPANVHVVTGRLDSGLSPDVVLATPPGTRWSEERGLDADGYIVPGAGGVGEVLNNSWC